MKDVNDSAANAVTQLNLFAQAIRNRLTALENGAGDAENAQYAENAGKLEGLTLSEVVEMIAGTVGLTTQEVLDQLEAHVARVDNPHGVTAEQVGLGNVENLAMATEAEAGVFDAATAINTAYMSPKRTAQMLAAFWADQVGSSPQTLDTIQEIADAIATNQDAVTSINDAIATRATKTELQDAVTALEGQLADKADQTALDALQTSVSDQIAAIDASTVGLENVDNFATATATEGRGVTYTYTAGAAQTAFTGPDDASNTLVVGPNDFVAGFLNDVKLESSEFTIDAANDSIAVPTAVETDVVEFVVWSGEKFMTAASTGALVEDLRYDTANAIQAIADELESQTTAMNV